MQVQRTVYKLVDAKLRTFNGYQWVIGEKRTFPGNGELCSSAYCHAYADPLLAVCVAPAHVSFEGMRMLVGPALVERDDGTKLGCVEFTPEREISLPAVPPSAVLTRWAIYCARTVLRPGASPKWDSWASAWLSGRNRAAAANAAYAATDVHAANATDVHAAYAAANAAYVATYAATYAATDVHAARAATYAATYAAANVAAFDALDLLRRAIKDEAVITEDNV